MRLILRALPGIALAAISANAMADITGPTPLAWRWAESAKASPSGTPQFLGDNVIVAVGGRVYSLNKATGNLNWRYPSGEPIAGSFSNGCTLSGNTVYAAGDEKGLYAIDANTGQLKWQYVADAPITSNAVVSGNTVGFVTNKQNLVFVDSATGAPAGAPFTSPAVIHDDIAAFGDQVIYTTARGRMVSFDTSSARAKWDVDFRSLKPTGNFTIFNDRIYVNSSNFVICVRASSGSAIWQENLGRDLIGKPAASDSGIATLTANGELYLLNTNGRPMFGKPASVGVPAGSPSFVGNMVQVPTANGAINLIDPKSGTSVWSYVISPIVRQAAQSAAAAGPSGGPGGIGGDGGNTGGIGGAPGGGAGSTQAQTQTQTRNYTLVAGFAALSGNSLFVLTRDASLLMFDRDLGVDLTPPNVEMLWPFAGNEIAGKAPMEMIFKLEDLGIGINPDSVKVTVNNKEYVHRLTNDGFLSILIITRGANPQIANGRATISVTASDWLGNQIKKDFSIVIDNSLAPLGSPPTGTTNNNQGGLGGGGGNRGGDGS